MSGIEIAFFVTLICFLFILLDTMSRHRARVNSLKETHVLKVAELILLLDRLMPITRDMIFLNQAAFNVRRNSTTTKEWEEFDSQFLKALESIEEFLREFGSTSSDVGSALEVTQGFQGYLDNTKMNDHSSE